MNKTLVKVSVNGDGTVLWAISKSRVLGSTGGGFSIWYYALNDVGTQRWNPVSGAATSISAF